MLCSIGVMGGKAYLRLTEDEKQVTPTHLLNLSVPQDINPSFKSLPPDDPTLGLTLHDLALSSYLHTYYPNTQI